MTSRREARRPTAPAANQMPADLASGPCIEDWADAAADWPAGSAFRNWTAVADEWARSVGFSDGPVMNARNLARMRRPWSRDFLIAEGRQELADYYDGRRADRPKENA